MNNRLSLKQQIERVTSPLIGIPVWDAGRAADLIWFAFGKPKTIRDSRGKPKEVGEYALHVQCAWRFVQHEKVLVGSRDLYYPAGYHDQSQEIPEDFDWDVQGANRCDELLRALFEGGAKQFVVQRVEVGQAGALSLVLKGGLILQIFPHDSFGGEHWRLFRPGSDEPHRVLTGKGLESQ